MPRYRMLWKEDVVYMATIEAESEEKAVAIVKAGKYEDPDTEPGNGKARDIVCEGEE